MEQIHLVVYLKDRDCEEVRRDKNGYFVMRNKKDTTKICGVPVPTNKDGILKPETICLICKQLGVEQPSSAPKELEIVMARIQEDVDSRINNGDMH